MSIIEIIFWSITYLILILILHNLYIYFKENLTITKTKDYFNIPANEYEKINTLIDNHNNNNNNNNNNQNNQDKNLNNNQNNEDNMKNELNEFLEKLNMS